MVAKKPKVSKKRKKRSRRKVLGADSGVKTSPFDGAKFFGYEKRNLKPFAICLGVITLLIFAAHAITIWGEFVYLDLFNIAEIRHTRDWGQFANDLFLFAMVNPLNEPLVRLTLTIDILSMGIRSPGIFHAINMLIHLSNSLLLFLLIRRLSNYENLRDNTGLNADIVALAGAALFACHPLTCGAISYISARSALLVVANYLISVHLFISGFLAKEIKPALYCYGYAYIFVLFGIWSGPQAITIPGAFILLAFLLKPKAITYKTWVTDRPFEFFAQILVAIFVPLVLLLNFTPLVGNGFGLQTLPLVEYMATQFKVLATYTIRCFLVPYGLTLDPPMAISTGFGDPLTLLGLGIVILAGFLSYKFKKNIVLSFGLGLFVLSLIPSCFVPHPEYVSITRIYWTTATMAIVSGYFVAKLFLNKPTMAMVLTSVLAIALVGLSNYRNYQWHSDARLWESAKNLNPTSKRSAAMHSWSIMFGGGGDLDKSYKLAKNAYKKDKNNAVLDLILANYHFINKEYKKAYKFFKEGAELAENQNLSEEIVFKLQYGLARSAIKLDDYETALKYAKKAAKIQKNNANLYLIQGQCLMQQDNPQGAFMKLQQSYLIDKTNPELIEPIAWAAIGCGTEELQDMGYKMAIQAYRVHSGKPQVVLLRAYAALETGRVYESLNFIRQYIQSNKKANAKALYILYGAYKKLGKEKESKVFLSLALEANPRIRKEMRLYLNRDIVKIKMKKKKKDGEKTEKTKVENKLPTREIEKGLIDGSIKVQPETKKKIIPKSELQEELKKKLLSPPKNISDPPATTGSSKVVAPASSKSNKNSGNDTKSKPAQKP